jgi:DNA-directed RNA polymerase sigma subunit (sigma70/sigma32)
MEIRVKLAELDMRTKIIPADELRRLDEEGKSLKYIANHFNVSVTRIRKERTVLGLPPRMRIRIVKKPRCK